MSQQVAVRMDSEEARVFQVGAKEFDESTIHSLAHHVHRHPKDQLTRTHNHPDDEHRFFGALADTLKDAEQILILGPSMRTLLRNGLVPDGARAGELAAGMPDGPVGSSGLAATLEDGYFNSWLCSLERQTGEGRRESPERDPASAMRGRRTRWGKTPLVQPHFVLAHGDARHHSE